jgi:hypothetical protein
MGFLSIGLPSVIPTLLLIPSVGLWLFSFFSLEYPAIPAHSLALDTTNMTFFPFLPRTDLRSRVEVTGYPLSS